MSRRLAKGYIVGRIQDEPGSKPQCWVWDRLAGKCQGLYFQQKCAGEEQRPQPSQASCSGIDLQEVLLIFAPVFAIS